MRHINTQKTRWAERQHYTLDTHLFRQTVHTNKHNTSTRTSGDSANTDFNSNSFILMSICTASPRRGWGKGGKHSNSSTGACKHTRKFAGTSIGLRARTAELKRTALPIFTNKVHSRMLPPANSGSTSKQRPDTPHLEASKKVHGFFEPSDLYPEGLRQSVHLLFTFHQRDHAWRGTARRPDSWTAAGTTHTVVFTAPTKASTPVGCTHTAIIQRVCKHNIPAPDGTVDASAVAGAAGSRDKVYNWARRALTSSSSIVTLMASWQPPSTNDHTCSMRKRRGDATTQHNHQGPQLCTREGGGRGGVCVCVWCGLRRTSSSRSIFLVSIGFQVKCSTFVVAGLKSPRATCDTSFAFSDSKRSKRVIFCTQPSTIHTRPKLGGMRVGN
jgi:hypothetical protein